MVAVAPSSARAVPPGPPARHGLFDRLRYGYHFLVEPIDFVGRRFERYGDIYYAPAGGVGLYVLRHPDHIWEVLVRDGAKYGKTHTAFDVLTKFLGYGLLTTDGETWRRQRRMVQPAFARKRLDGYAAVMTAEAERAIAGWHEGQVREMSREMMELTLSVVCRTLFGHDVHREADEVWQAMDAFHRYLAPSMLPEWLPVPGRRRADEAVATLDRIIYGMIEKRRAGRAADPPDLLQMLLDAVDEEGDQGRMSDQEIRDQLITLFLAGHETTSHALTWTFFLLSQSPAAAAELKAELARELGGRTPTLDDLERLPYTRQVFEESMRLFPPAYTLARRAEKDATIAGYPVPAGSEVIIWTYLTHRDPRWYPAPHVFDPTRFAPAAVAARPRCAYLPFGAGARACIGKMFAMVEGQLLLATVAQRFGFELAPGQRVELNPRVTLAPKHGMRMVLRS